MLMIVVFAVEPVAPMLTVLLLALVPIVILPVPASSEAPPVPACNVRGDEPTVDPTTTVVLELAVALLPMLIVWLNAPVVLPI